MDEVRLKTKMLSGYITPRNKVNSIFCGRYKRNGYSVEVYVLHGKNLNPKEGNTDAAVGGKIERLVKEGYVVAAPDVIGTGDPFFEAQIYPP